MARHAQMPKAPKTTSLQYHRNEMLDYLNLSILLQMIIFN